MNETPIIEDLTPEFEMRAGAGSVIFGAVALAAILAVVNGSKYYEYHKNGASMAWILSDAVQIPPFVRGEMGVGALIALALWGYCRSRRIMILGNALRRTSWFSDRSWPIAELTEAAYEVVRTEKSESSGIAVRRRDGEDALWLTRPTWKRDDLRRLLDAVKARNPSFRISDDARDYVSG